MQLLKSLEQWDNSSYPYIGIGFVLCHRLIGLFHFFLIRFDFDFNCNKNNFTFFYGKYTNRNFIAIFLNY